MKTMKIDILCQAEKKSDNFVNAIRLAAQSLNIDIQMNCTSDFANFSQHAINPSQTPIVIINGNVEFAGRLPDLETIKMRLAQIQDQGDMVI